MKLFEMIQQIGSRAGTRAATAFLKSLSLSHTLTQHRRRHARQTPTSQRAFFYSRAVRRAFISTCVCYKRIKKADAQLIFRPATTSHSCQLKNAAKVSRTIHCRLKFNFESFVSLKVLCIY
jgi:hypothetical protein